MRNAQYWFQTLTGFYESSAAVVKANIKIEGEHMTSLANGRVFTVGRFEMPSLDQLRMQIHQKSHDAKRLRIAEIVADVRDLLADPVNAGAFFQVASQFNLLEMSSPDVTPESGVGIYQHDQTQGPACAISAGAGTIYRNYFVPLRGKIGQSFNNQIDCLADLGAALNNDNDRLWRMQNGYALPTAVGLAEISAHIEAAADSELDRLRGLLRIGLQWNTEVTVSESAHLLTQAYCSAMPVSYSHHAQAAWEPFARLILEAAYEATLYAAVLNAQATGNHSVFLTTLGGGAFGNPMNWICDAIERAVLLLNSTNLQVYIVSYRSSDPHVGALISKLSEI